MTDRETKLVHDEKNDLLQIFKGNININLKASEVLEFIQDPEVKTKWAGLHMIQS